MKSNIVERKFVGQWASGQHKGSLDILTVKTERSKPIGAIAKLLEDRFTIAHEIKTVKKGESNSICKAENKSKQKSCEPKFSHTPNPIRNTIPSFYPITEAKL